MPKFCTQCGSPLNEDAAFCNSCGTKVAGTEETTVENTPITDGVTETVEVETVNKTEETSIETESTETTVPETASTDTAANQTTSEVQQPAGDSTPLDKGIAFAKDKVGDKYEAFKTSPNRDKYIGFAAIGIVAIVVICVVLSLIFGGGYKSPIKNYFNFIESGDFDDYIDATPDIIYEAMLDNFDDDEDEMIEMIEDMYSSLLDDVKIKSIDYDIKDSEKFNSDQLEELEDEIQDQYEDYVDDDIKVSKAYEVEVKVKTKIKGEDSKTERLYIIVAKVNGDWGVIGEPSSKSQIENYE